MALFDDDLIDGWLSDMLPQAGDLPTIPGGSGYPSPSSRMPMSGHSLVDAIESGSADPRQTKRTLIPAGQPPGIWRRNTIPGSKMQIRWGNRWGGDYSGNPPVTDPGPLDFQNPNSPLITARDIGQFDIFLITEAGPFSLPLNPDRVNALWNDSVERFGG